MSNSVDYIPELLAPAGEPEAAYGAFSAGADAVYLGASYSARAYAKNFTEEELISVIRYAHLFNKKVYLASNILMKNTELAAAVEAIRPFYEEGLDGIIVQDLGLLKVLSETYPGLPLHASTQMTILSEKGIAQLKKMGACRVVPGRELSLSEIKELKATGMEVECFIHGAMCYSYSGKCLFSSLAGGRSGNRGRCAGPCRKKYFCENGKGCYPISMKDMNSLSLLPSLLDAKVNSFKIEGRMKDASYSAGVTEIYRKYIDLYLKNGEICIDPKDYAILAGLYQRSERQVGYLDKYNGKDMISISSPAYNKTSDELVKHYREKYVEMPKKRTVNSVVKAKVSEPLFLQMESQNTKFCCRLNEPLAVSEKECDVKANIEKHFVKFGETDFCSGELTIEADANAFVPVSQIKELRRKGLTLLESEILKKNMPYFPVQIAEMPVFHGEGNSNKFMQSVGEIRIGICNEKQLNAVSTLSTEFSLILPLFASDTLYEKAFHIGCTCYLRLPEIVRQKSLARILGELLRLSEQYSFVGYYAESMDGLALLKEYFPKEKIVMGNGIYAMNMESCALLLEEAERISVPYELNEKEIMHLPTHQMEMQCYGYLPLMYSANCLMKTVSSCNTGKDVTFVRDEEGRLFRAKLNHTLCYNVLYNYVPLSLQQNMKRYMERSTFCSYRLEFTLEDGEETKQVLNAFFGGKEGTYPYTNGHIKRGVL